MTDALEMARGVEMARALAAAPSPADLILALYYLVLGILAFYGAHRLVLLTLYYRHRRPASPPPEPAVWPRVTVQLPIFNELYVAERLVRAVCALDYPRELLEIQVLDDSDDETAEEVARLVAHQRRRGVAIEHVRREGRAGFKAGALAAGLEHAGGELLAVFDADFVPHPDFLRRTVPWFADPAIGMVQARWEHINRDYSLLTRIQAVFLDGHFLIEHAARSWSGRFFNFNGTAGVWRRQAIADAGGWQHDTLTEDLDLSYRAQLAGWRFVFLPEVAAPAELPVQINAFKRQQYRWAKGSIQTARKLLGRLLAAPVPWRIKLEGFIHLTNNAAYFLMVLLSLLIFPAMMYRREHDPLTLLAIDLPLLVAATVSVLLYYLASQRAQGRGWTGSLATLLPLMGLGIGLSVNNCRAVVDGLVADGGTFERTPKYRIERQDDSWRAKRYRVARGSSVIAEGALAAYLGICLGMAVALEMWWSIPFLYLFFHGYCYIFLLSVAPVGWRDADAGTAAGTGGGGGGLAADGGATPS